jgi:hypothetical protein
MLPIASPEVEEKTAKMRDRSGFRTGILPMDDGYALWRLS